MYVNDDDAGSRIMKATTLVDCFKIGWELNSKLDLNAWQSVFTIKAMTDGLKGKFSPNPHLLKFLMSTKGKRLVEANPRDTYWSSGISPNDSNKLLDIKNWPGKKRARKCIGNNQGSF